MPFHFVIGFSSYHGLVGFNLTLVIISAFRKFARCCAHLVRNGDYSESMGLSCVFKLSCLHVARQRYYEAWLFGSEWVLKASCLPVCFGGIEFDAPC